MFTLLKIIFHRNIALCKKLCLDNTHDVFTFYVKLHVFREIVKAVNLIGGLGCDVSTVCAQGWPVLCRGWVYKEAWSWRGWEGRCPLHRLSPSTHSSDLDRKDKISFENVWHCTHSIQKSKNHILFILCVKITICNNNYFQKDQNKVTIASNILLFLTFLLLMIGYWL